jgi:acetyltransferase-like isoleucine patch superfamily enzyme
MTVGKHTYGHEQIVLIQAAYADLIIGNFCSIGNNLTVYLGSDHRVDWISTFPFGHSAKQVFTSYDGHGHPRTRGNVVIENDVWTGLNASIMSGVHVGDGAVIAANAHVVKNVEPYTVVGGNPAHVIRKRFNDEIIAKLLYLQWWNLPDWQINEIAPLLCSSDFDKLFAKFNL